MSSITSKKKKTALRTVTAAALISLGIAAFYHGLAVRKYSIDSHKLPKGQSIRVAIIADLHSRTYGKNQQQLIERIQEMEPDIIALCGDIVDDEAPYAGAFLLLQQLPAIAPTYYVTGNHEQNTYAVPMIKETIRKYGITVLENTYVEAEIQGIPCIIAGMEDPRITPPQKMEQNFTPLKERSEYKILLAHRPEFYPLYERTGFDLALSGHAHGGQIRIPFLLNGLFSPNQGLFPPYAGGCYQHGDLYHVVSRGLFRDWRLPRVFNPPELVLVTVSGV